MRFNFCQNFSTVKINACPQIFLFFEACNPPGGVDGMDNNITSHIHSRVARTLGSLFSVLSSGFE